MTDIMQDTASLLRWREELTEDAFQETPYLLFIYLIRAQVHAALGFPDLAVMDAYKALLLVDETIDDSGEYHEQAAKEVDHFLEELKSSKESRYPGVEPLQVLETELRSLLGKGLELQQIVETFATTLRRMLIHYLTTIRCLRSAYVFVQQIQRSDVDSATSVDEIDRFYTVVNKHFEGKGQTADTINAIDLPDRALVRREIYPWNHHEEDRTSPEALQLLNDQMKAVSTKMDVKVVELPVLPDETKGRTSSATVKQLGLFANQDIEPGEEVLRERSLLTANARFSEPICDACSAELPELRAADGDDEGNAGPIPCDDCDDIAFCSQKCHDLAQDAYHPAICGLDIESIFLEVPKAEAADSLYTLLLLRSLAISQTNEVHPLDSKEVKYICGDFSTPASYMSDAGLGALANGDAQFAAGERALPFSFSANILLPLHILEKMELNIFEPHSASGINLELSEGWVINTLYAKYRGTASGRVNPRDGRPEMAAVHPLWCLANHDCDPNVQWEWAGEIQFTCREKRGKWTRKDGEQEVVGRDERSGGIKKGEEILNHYVDIELPVKDRREWGSGALGGNCMCERCRWEAGEMRKI
jgi:hypothetical protein